MSTNDKPAGILSAERLAELRRVVRGSIRGGSVAEGDAALDAILAHLDAITPREVDENALGQMARTFAYPGSRASETFRNMPQYERQKWIDIAVPIYHLGYAAGRLAGEARPPGATCEGCATLRERLAAAERERGELRSERATWHDMREMIRSDLHAHDDETTSFAARRLAAELAEARAERDATRCDDSDLRAEIAKLRQERDAARAEGAKEEREACAKIAEAPHRATRGGGPNDCVRIAAEIRARGAR